MARNSKSTATENRAPDFIAWHVAEKGEKSFWSKIGASWLHKDGQGMTLQLEVLPVNGRVVLRQAAESPQDDKRA